MTKTLAHLRHAEWDLVLGMERRRFHRVYADKLNRPTHQAWLAFGNLGEARHYLLRALKHMLDGPDAEFNRDAYFAFYDCVDEVGAELREAREEYRARFGGYSQQHERKGRTLQHPSGSPTKAFRVEEVAMPIIVPPTSMNHENGGSKR